jgi:protease-4
MQKIVFISVAMLAFTATGCMPEGGFLVRPVPVTDKLEETVIGCDRGFLVSDKIAVIDVNGMLMNASTSGLLGLGGGENPTDIFIQKLDMVQCDPDVKAVVIRVNSPGGGVTASDIMYHHLCELKTKRHIPVVACIEDVGASGAYYLSCASDVIMAHPTAVTGSIGVIVQTMSIAGTLNKIGVDTKAITSGPNKEMGSPLKPLDPKDAELLQVIVNDNYENFLSVVKKGRPKLAGLSAPALKAIADGRVYTANQAKANGLIDEIGYVEDAVAKAKTMAHVKRARTVMYHQPLGYKENVYSQSPAVPAAGTQVNLINISAAGILDLTQPRILYLWTGKN